MKKNNTIIKFTLPFFLLFFSFNLSAQNVIIKGKVLDEKTNQALENVSVSVLGVGNFGKTNQDGEFQIKGLRNQAYTLTFSFYPPIITKKFAKNILFYIFYTVIQAIIRAGLHTLNCQNN